MAFSHSQSAMPPRQQPRQRASGERSAAHNRPTARLRQSANVAPRLCRTHSRKNATPGASQAVRDPLFRARQRGIRLPSRSAVRKCLRPCSRKCHWPGYPFSFTRSEPAAPAPQPACRETRAPRRSCRHARHAPSSPSSWPQGSRASAPVSPCRPDARPR